MCVWEWEGGQGGGGGPGVDSYLLAHYMLWTRDCMYSFCAAEDRIVSSDVAYELQLPHPRETDGRVCLRREQAEEVEV